MAFQPVVDLRDNTVFAYEALVRGVFGEPSETILRQVTADNHFAFDSACREQSVRQAAALRMQDGTASLAINICCNLMDSPNACVLRTLDLANQLHFPLDRLILEITEHERARDYVYLNHLAVKYRGYGMRIAIDDFGSGYSGLEMLSEFDPDIVKIDRAIVRGLDKVPPNRVIVEAMVQMADRLHIQVIAEGVETRAEYETLAKMGVYLMQGYYFARPELDHLPTWIVPVEGWQGFQAGPGARVPPCPPIPAMRKMAY